MGKDQDTVSGIDIPDPQHWLVLNNLLKNAQRPLFFAF
jgi:hypothetical protein